MGETTTNTRNKYITAMDIYMRLVSTFRIKMQEVDRIQVIRWCSEVITDYLKDPVGLVEKRECVVNGKDKLIVDGRIQLPTDIFKLQGVYDGNRELLRDFLYQGDYLILPDRIKPQNVSIHYYALAVDKETGYQLIKKGYEPACYAYCVYKMYEEDATLIPPRIPQWRWLQIVQDKEWEIEAAHRSWDGLTDNEIQEIHNYILSPDYMQIVYGIGSKPISGGAISNESKIC